ELDEVRHDFRYQTDGAVIKLNSYSLRETVGCTAKAPRWAMAYKYAAEQAQTKLKQIRIQVGRAGALTPVADLEPVFLAGSTIRRDPQFVVWRCENILCPAQATRRLEFFTARGALDIEGIGGVVADKLVETGLVRDSLDVFKLEVDKLAALNLGTPEAPRVFGR